MGAVAEGAMTTSALPVGEVYLPEAVDLRSKRGKKYAAEKKRLTIELRKQGYTLKAIAKALGSAESTLSMYLWEYSPELLHRPPARKFYSAETEREAVEKVQTERDDRKAAQRARIDAYREARRRGERLPCEAPWMPAVALTPEQEEELASLVTQQERELERVDAAWGERPYRSRSVGWTRSIDERLESRRSDSQGGRADELHEIVADKTAPSPEDIYIEQEFETELREALGDITLQHVERLDDRTLERLADKLRDGGLVHLGVQRKERQRLKTPARHRGYAPPRTQQPVNVGSRKKRRDKLGKHSRPKQKPRRAWQREKVVYDWKAAA